MWKRQQIRRCLPGTLAWRWTRLLQVLSLRARRVIVLQCGARNDCLGGHGAFGARGPRCCRAGTLVCGLCETSQCKLCAELGESEPLERNGAIELWAAGDKNILRSALFKREIEALQSAGTLDPAELEKLKTLGYIQ